jgi:hypothetical protein
MRRFLTSTLLCLAATACGRGGMEEPSNIALGYPVYLTGSFGTLNESRTQWLDQALPSSTASILTDGFLFADGSIWHRGTVWWDATVPGAESNSILIDLKGPCRIQELVIQADNNDSYEIHAHIEGEWRAITTAEPSGPFGLQTRRLALDAAVDTDALEIRAVDGDSLYSVAEIEALGWPLN